MYVLQMKTLLCEKNTKGLIGKRSCQIDGPSLPRIIVHFVSMNPDNMIDLELGKVKIRVPHTL